MSTITEPHGIGNKPAPSPATTETTNAFDALPLGIISAISDVEENARALATTKATYLHRGLSVPRADLQRAYARRTASLDQLATLIEEYRTYVDPDGAREPGDAYLVEKRVDALTIADTLVLGGHTADVESVTVYESGSIHNGSTEVHTAFGILRKRSDTMVTVLAPLPLTD